MPSLMMIAVIVVVGVISGDVTSLDELYCFMIIKKGYWTEKQARVKHNLLPIQTVFEMS